MHAQLQQTHPAVRSSSTCSCRYGAGCGRPRPHSTCRSSSPCFNSCNGRGSCVAGICHCKPGFWGMDCALSRAPQGGVELLAGQGYVPRKDGVKVRATTCPLQTQLRHPSPVLHCDAAAPQLQPMPARCARKA
jgi:hypothetical protein